jgi:hypothetical protein
VSAGKPCSPGGFALPNRLRFGGAFYNICGLMRQTLIAPQFIQPPGFSSDFTWVSQ